MVLSSCDRDGALVNVARQCKCGASATWAHLRSERLRTEFAETANTVVTVVRLPLRVISMRHRPGVEDALSLVLTPRDGLGG